MRVVNDRRTWPRVMMRGDVRVHLRRGVLECHCIDLSVCGMKVLSPKSVRPRHRATIETSFDGHPMALSAVVVRRKRTPQGYHLGLRFEDLEDHIQARIEKIVRTMHQKTTLAQRTGMYLDSLPGFSLPDPEVKTERAPHRPAPPPPPLVDLEPPATGPANDVGRADLAPSDGQPNWVHPIDSGPVLPGYRPAPDGTDSTPPPRSEAAPRRRATLFEPPPPPQEQTVLATARGNVTVRADGSRRRPTAEDIDASERPDPYDSTVLAAGPKQMPEFRRDEAPIEPENWDSTMLTGHPQSVPPTPSRPLPTELERASRRVVTEPPAIVPFTAEDNWTEDELDTQSYRMRKATAAQWEPTVDLSAETVVHAQALPELRDATPNLPRVDGSSSVWGKEPRVERTSEPVVHSVTLGYLGDAAPFEEPRRLNPHQPERIEPPAIDEFFDAKLEFSPVAGLYDSPVQSRQPEPRPMPPQPKLPPRTRPDLLAASTPWTPVKASSDEAPPRSDD